MAQRTHDKADDVEKVTKSIRIDPKLWRRARVRALEEGRTIQDLVADSLRKYLAKEKAGGKAAAGVARGDVFDSRNDLKFKKRGAVTPPLFES
jgi:hypothetical protein